MTGNPGDGAEQALIARILADAEASAREHAERAAHAVHDITEQAAREAETTARTVAAQAYRDADRVRNQAAAHARMEARRLILHAREEALARALDRIEHAVRAIHDDPGLYRRALPGLVAECLRAVTEPGTVLTFGAADKDLVEGGVLAEAQKLAGGEAEQRETTICYDGANLGGGCVATSPDGRIHFDNTLPRRLADARPHLRSLLAHALGEDRG